MAGLFLIFPIKKLSKKLYYQITKKLKEVLQVFFHSPVEPLVLCSLRFLQLFQGDRKKDAEQTIRFLHCPVVNSYLFH